MSWQPPSLAAAWSRLFGALFGLACGLLLLLGATVFATGAQGLFGNGLDIAAGLLGLCGVVVTCIDMVQTGAQRLQGNKRPLLVGAFLGQLALGIAAIAVCLAIAMGAYSMASAAPGALRPLLVFLAIYQLAIAIWLQSETGP